LRVRPIVEKLRQQAKKIIHNDCDLSVLLIPQDVLLQQGVL